LDIRRGSKRPELRHPPQSPRGGSEGGEKIPSAARGVEKFRIAALVLGYAFLCGSAGGAEYKLEPLKDKPPAEVAGPLGEALLAGGVRLLDKKGMPLVDVWLRKEIPGSPSKKPPGIKFEEVSEGSFLGVARFHQKHFDFKNKPIPPGTYTLRLGVQPSDGDHLGVSETRDFALLSPVAADKSLAPMPTSEVVKLSCQVSGTKHPAVLWLKPMSGEAKDLPALVHQEDREYEVLDFRLPLAGEKEKAARLGLVLVGTAPDA
jgi:hypothetical protein